MMLRVGELATHAGLTVRTLSHYHEMALLIPSARSETGYGVYTRDDIARLHQIQALRGLGTPLSAVSAALTSSEHTLTLVLERQILALEADAQQPSQLYKRLMTLKNELLAGQEPAVADWLRTLALMSSYERYVEQDRLSRLPFYQASSAWQELAQQAAALYAQGKSPSSDAAQQLAHRWMTTLECDLGQAPQWLLTLLELQHSEPLLQAQLGLTPQLAAFLLKAFAESRLNLLARYLDSDEMAYVRPRYLEQMLCWPELLLALNETIEQGLSPDSQEAKALATRWLAMFFAYAGPNPQTRHKIRQAMRQEPRLSQGTWLGARGLYFLQTAAKHARRAAL